MRRLDGAESKEVFAEAAALCKVGHVVNFVGGWVAGFGEGREALRTVSLTA